MLVFVTTSSSVWLWERVTKMRWKEVSWRCTVIKPLPFSSRLILCTFPRMLGLGLYKSFLLCQIAPYYTLPTVRTGHGTTDWFQIGKGVRQGCILSPCLFNLYAEYIMWNVGLEEAQAGIKIAGRNINNHRYADDTTLMAEGEEELKSLEESERGEWKSWLKTQFRKLRSWDLVPSPHGK